MDISREILASITTDIWSSMLGIDLEPSVETVLGPPQRTLIGCVQISGDWTGAVTVRCHTTTARQFAAVMFDCDPDSLPLDEVCDALGELTNMTGGSVKGVVEGTCQLSIPTVAEGLDYRLTIPKAVPLTELGLDYAGEPLEVIVYEIK